ncbi:MAG: DNA mismatch repair protein MutS, partial [Chloroflexota bacterium]
MTQGATPIRQQYLRIKQQYPEAIVLFRLGDFYETFDEDARTASRELEIVLTSREMGKGIKVPLAGIPYHALDNYLAKLISRGYKVAVCEQVTKPGENRGLVEREVVRLVTPGTVVEPGLLDSRANNYLVALLLAEKEAGLAFVDITTSEFATTQLPLDRVASELERLKPREIIAPENADLSLLGYEGTVTRVEDYWFEAARARQSLLEHFRVATLEGYGCERLPLATGAAGAILAYLRETRKGTLPQLNRVSTYTTDAFMALDAQTQHNLELFQGTGSLLSVIDLTKTASGGRLLKKWLGQPLLDVAALNSRLDAVEWFAGNIVPRREVIGLLGQMADLERLVNRVRSEIAIPRELITLKNSLELIPRLRNALDSDRRVAALKDQLKSCPEVVALVDEAIVAEPSSTFGEGDVMKPGLSEELDKLRGASRNARQYLASLEAQEREKTGIKSLKIGFNNVFGYYLEVSKPNLAQVPDSYIRKQTLVNGERYFTPELKEYEALILNAKERITELEESLFRRVCRQVATAGERVLAVAGALAQLDVFAALAELAAQQDYVRPALDDGTKLEIRQGRHPVVERNLSPGGFTPNDVLLDNADAQVVILTGPNMSGKSTYLRQVALVVLLAQTGSFVPAASARLGIVDRIFTRIGAREDLAAGQS